MNRRRPTTSKPSAGADPGPVDELLQTARRSRASLSREAAEAQRQVILFEVGRRRFSVPIDAVERTERPSAVTPVPRAPDWVRGITSLRGEVVTVIDLARLLGHEEVGRVEETRSLLLIADQGRRLAVQSSSLADFIRVSDDQERSLPPAEVDVYTGGIEVSGALIGVLDPAKLFEFIETLLERS